MVLSELKGSILDGESCPRCSTCPSTEHFNSTARVSLLGVTLPAFLSSTQPFYLLPRGPTREVSVGLLGVTAFESAVLAVVSGISTPCLTAHYHGFIRCYAKHVLNAYEHSILHSLPISQYPTKGVLGQG